MSRVAVPACLVIALVTAAAPANFHAQALDQQYTFIDADKTASKWTGLNFSKLRDRLMDAVSRGNSVKCVAVSSGSMNLLLTQDHAVAGSHRLIWEGREGAFLDALNRASADGFQVVADGIKAFEDGSGTTWVGVLVKRSDPPPVKYSLVKGTEEGQRALDGSAAAGRRLVAMLGRQGMVSAKTLLFFADGAEPGSVRPTGVHRIIATARTSALLKDVQEAAAAGFRVVGSGFGHMTILMARQGEQKPLPVEYRLAAMIIVRTLVKELNAAGAEGFRVVAISENGPEGVFILERQPDAPQRFMYEVLILKEPTANQALTDAEADGYRILRLFSDVIVLERPTLAE